MKAITKISSFIQASLKALPEQKPKYIYVSHIYRDALKEADKSDEIDKLEKAWGVKIIFT